MTAICFASLLADADLDALTGGVLRAWSFPVLPFLGLALTTAIYLRGFRLARRTRPQELPTWRAWSFLGGILALWIAIASPIDALDDFLLTAHMIQHFILMSVAPPLIILGNPLVPMLRGLPRWLIRRSLRPLFASRGLQRILHTLTHPAILWLLFNVAYLGWHTPPAFEATFRSERVHNLEHLCFFLTSLGFWWVVLQPWPSQARWPRWAAIPYLLSADLVNTILSALLAFCGRVLYPSYAAAPRITHLTALEDQIAAGSEMWVLNSLVMLVPAVLLTVYLLNPRKFRGYATEEPLAEPQRLAARPARSGQLTPPR